MHASKGLHVERIESGALPVVVYRLSGILTSSKESYDFLEGVRTQVQDGRNRIVLNLSGVTILTSAGVGILAACYTSVQNAGGRLHLAAVPERSAAILRVVHLLDLIPDARTEAEAIEGASV